MNQTTGILKWITLVVIAMVFSMSYRLETKKKDISFREYFSTDSIGFEYEKITGIGYEKGISRRDPSDIIKVGDLYYVYYTLIPATTDRKRTPLYNSGYYGTVWCATSPDGYTWTEEGQVLGIGPSGTFDSHAVFTPNILEFNNKFYLYYTGVKPTPGRSDGKFENNSENDITGIGVAVAQNPGGPFKRVVNQPVIVVSDNEDEFDSYRVDDASLMIKDEKIWLYYKGRSMAYGKSGPRHTKMGVAISKYPEGPFKKHLTPLLEGSHEVLIWYETDGVSSLASLTKSINHSTDGFHFSEIYSDLSNIPKAPGLFRPHLTNHSKKKIPGWGIAMKGKDNDLYLERFDINVY